MHVYQVCKNQVGKFQCEISTWESNKGHTMCMVLQWKLLVMDGGHEVVKVQNQYMSSWSLVFNFEKNADEERAGKKVLNLPGHTALCGDEWTE